MGNDLSQFQWDAVSLRMTAFPRPGSELTATDWWRSVVGEVSEQQTMNPQSGEFLESGKFGPGILELKISPVNVTWVYRMEDRQQETVRVSIGDFRTRSREFRSLMDKWFDLDAFSNPIRMAFGAILIQPVRNQEEGFVRLSDYISAISFNPPPSSSFLYQLNRRRESTLDIEDLVINRVMKWSLAQQQLMVHHPDGRVDFASAAPNSLVHLEIDINTIPEFEGEFDKGCLPKVFGELVELGIEIAEKGDIP